MKTVLKQLFYMNLAVLMAVLLILPAVAEDAEAYTLTLHANWAGDETRELTNAPETEYTLSEYIFRRDSYVQVAWADATDGDASHRLNALYVPVTSTDLYAFWLEAGVGQIVLNSLDGDLDAQGTFYEKHTTTVTLPEELVYPDGSDALLAWSTEVAPKTDEQGVLNGLWYSGGDEVRPDAQKRLELYGHGRGGSAYVIYHPAEGALARGGSILVQQAQGNALALTLLDDSVLSAPDGYVFSGWERAGTAVSGSALTLQPGEVVHLYAGWEREAVVITPEAGIGISSAGDTVAVTLSAAWCQQDDVEQAVCALYDSDWKMLACAAGDLQPDGSILIELDYADHGGLHCRIFALDSDWLPVRAVVPCALPLRGAGS